MYRLINGKRVKLTKAQENKHLADQLKDAIPDDNDIKDEAARRIIELVPEWKQRNLLAQASILTAKGSNNWDAEDTAKWEAGLHIWNKVALIRAKSDDLEQMNPRPVDYTDDKHWGI